jgi:hypothetical protein
VKIEIKLLNNKSYKNDDNFNDAIERWQDKGWILADVAQDIKSHGFDAVAILWRPKEDNEYGLWRDTYLGWHLAASGDGLFNGKGERIAGDSEISIYNALGLAWQRPEERDWGGAMARIVDVDKTRSEIRHQFAMWDIDPSEFEILWEEDRSTGRLIRRPGARVRYMRDGQWQEIACYNSRLVLNAKEGKKWLKRERKSALERIPISGCSQNPGRSHLI